MASVISVDLRIENESISYPEGSVVGLKCDEENNDKLSDTESVTCKVEKWSKSWNL